MSKTLKLILSIFVGLDIFVVGWIGLAQLRFMLFGEGAIPGGGSALDMALFLLPAFFGYLAGDRLFYFLTYKERKEKARLRREQEQAKAALTPVALEDQASIWDEAEWQEGEATKGKNTVAPGQSATRKQEQ